ncbi:MAG: transglutaminase-like domain-containing protein, partial [Smithellaceae bacterium]|nr:transglutaminase-like domain-containing protein [Smithellaceae bacterium]
MKKVSMAVLAALLILTGIASGENYTVSGDMTSAIRYELQEQLTVGDGVKKLVLSFVVPPSFNSPTYRQEVRDFELKFSPEPQDRKPTMDERGNKIITATWTEIPAAIDVRLSLNAANTTKLKALETQAAFPLTKVDPSVADYLKATEQVQSDDPRIKELSTQLTKDLKTEFDAVQQVISYVVDHVHYVTPPAQYDALYSLDSGKGNCQNFSHLSAALLRAAKVPVRIVNGITLNQPFDVDWQKGILTFKMGQGRHSWIEVWFPDLGWVPFDPQNTELFVSNRFIRVEVGVDNNETKNDGLLRFAQAREAKTRPQLQENISASFDKDQVKIKGERQTYGPKNLLLCPTVKAAFKQIEVVPPPPP